MMLVVDEAERRDAGRAVARLDPGVMKDLNVRVGDIVRMAGSGAAYARAMPMHPGARGRGRIMLDGITRANAGLNIGDRTTVERIDLPPLDMITLKPIECRGDREINSTMLDGIPLAADQKVRINTMGGPCHFIVENAHPAAGIVKNATIVKIEGVRDTHTRHALVSYEDIGGLGPQVAKIREMIELPLKYPEIFQRIGIDPPKGVLLHGPPGTGKTLIARAAAQETEAHLIFLSGPEIIGKYYGESEAKLREIFAEAERNAPSIICIDEIDAIAPRREEVGGEKQVERRIVAQLLTLMDGLSGRGQCIVIATTNIPNEIDPALRRPGRFDREIEISAPDQSGRFEILTIHTRGMPLASDVDLSAIAAATHGYVGADLAALCRESAMHALREFLPEIDRTRKSLTYEELSRIQVTGADFAEAMREIEPSALREFLIEVPDVTWKDIGGLDSVIETVRDTVELPFQKKDLFARLKIRPPKGILFHGPPGTGKTLIARAVAHEVQANVIAVKGPQLVSRYVGDSERAIRELFRKARQASPCIIFFDEIDSIAPKRGHGGDSGVTERIIAQLLTEMDGLDELRGVLVVAATNRPDLIDEALLRPGRFDHIIELPLPGEKDRRAIFAVHTRDLPLAADVDTAVYARLTGGCSGADIAGICRYAALLAIKEYANDNGDINNIAISDRHFKHGLSEFAA